MRQRGGAGLATSTYGGVGDRRPVPHGHNITLADKQVRLAECDTPVHKLSGSRHDEETGLILFKLGPLVGLAGVLDRERVQVELGLRLVEQLGAGFV